VKTRITVALVAISFALLSLAQQTNTPPAPAATAAAQQKDTVDPKVEQQIRELAAKYDEAFNRNDAAAVAALYTEDAVFETPSGAFHGREAIEEENAKHYFEQDHSKNLVTVVDELSGAGNEVRATGTWSNTFEEGATIHANGTYLWVLIHQVDSWKIRKSTFDMTNQRR
jgi:uncharacterized protein (TIGR02246 family)